MKTNAKIASIGFSLALVAAQSFAQAPMKSIEKGGKMPGQPLDTMSVPMEVRTIYVTEYPAASYSEWYGYPAYTDETEWFIIDTTNYTTDPKMSENYVSQFSKDDTKQKVVYHKSGKKLAHHKHMKNASFPLAVSSAFDKSAYKSWKVVGDKVEITREADKMKVYKITVEKGKEKHSLFYDSKGKMIKDKTSKM